MGLIILTLCILLSSSAARLAAPKSLDAPAAKALAGALPSIPLPDIHLDQDTVTIDLSAMTLSGMVYDAATLTVGTDEVTATVTGAAASLAFTIKAREDIWPHPSIADTGTATLSNTKVVVSVSVDGTSTVSVKTADVELGDVDLKLNSHTDVAWLTDKLLAAFKGHLGKAIGGAIVANAQNLDVLALANNALAGRTMDLPDQHESIPGGGTADLTALELDHLGATSVALSIPGPNQLELAVGGATANGGGAYAFKELIVHGSGTVDITVGASVATVTLDIAPGSDLDSVTVGDPTTLALGDLKVVASKKVLQVVADLFKGIVKKELEKDFKSIVSKLLPGGAAPALILNAEEGTRIPLALK